MQYSFGSGVLYGRSLTSNYPTPVRFGALQDVSIDISFTTKELHGQYQFPLAVGRGTGKITGKAQWAQFNAQVYNDLFFGLSNPTTGSMRMAIAEAATISANAVTVTNSANFSADYGVVRASDGAIYQRVQNTPVGLQYTCNESTGVYGFNSSQNTVNVAVSYKYTDGANGKTISLTNQLLGNSPQFTAAFTETFNGKSLTIVLNACQSSKLTLATKLEDFTQPQFDFMAFADASGSMGNIYMDE